MQVDPISIAVTHSPSIWTALNIDYPGHSFAQLGIFHEGLNGRLPNQDLLNSFTMISEWGGVPVTLYGTPSTTPVGWLRWVGLDGVEFVREYVRRGRNVLRHVGFQASGRASGAHGVFHQYRIDAFTMFAIPDVGPHGFHSLGRIIESTLRTSNNLLERLHASFFFYIMTSPRTFLQVGHYLPAVLLISVATMIGALELWFQSEWHKLFTVDYWSYRSVHIEPKPHQLVYIMLYTHLAGGVLWRVAQIRTTFPIVSLVGLCVANILGGILPLRDKKPWNPPYYKTLKALSMALVSAMLSVMTVLNFSLSAVLTVVTVPLLIAEPDSDYFPLYCIAVELAGRALQKYFGTLKQWEVYGVWTEPFYWLVIVPLYLQAATLGNLSRNS